MPLNRAEIKSYAHNPSIASHPQIKNVIAVGSGKGGVGKSTTAVNLALALVAEGAQVGLLDADIYGPNVPLMLGAEGKPDLLPDKKFKPLLCHGLQTMSIGYLVDDDTAMVWRGPMISAALQQLYRDTLWQDLDFLIVDLPPGTGDIPLTLAKKIPVAGALVVTTPQQVAVHDARKACAMFLKLNIPVLGLIENMSLYVCSHCGEHSALLGAEGGVKLAQELEVPLLAQLPFDASIANDIEQGRPSVIAQPDGEVAKNYRAMALRMTTELTKRPVNYATKMPPVVVE